VLAALRAFLPAGGDRRGDDARGPAPLVAAR
jgi:hypothetical protein